jgi:hypothetical protein
MSGTDAKSSIGAMDAAAAGEVRARVAGTDPVLAANGAFTANAVKNELVDDKDGDRVVRRTDDQPPKQ